MNVFIQTLLDHNYSYYHLWPYYMMYCTIRVTEIEVYGTGDSMEGSHIYTDGKGVAGRESWTRRRWGGGLAGGQDFSLDLCITRCREATIGKVPT